MLNGLDDEAKSRTRIVDVLLHDLLHDCRLPSIIKSAISESTKNVAWQRSSLGTDSIRIRISLSLRRAFRRIESMVAGLCPAAMFEEVWWSRKMK